jgi:hypothetical protein
MLACCSAIKYHFDRVQSVAQAYVFNVFGWLAEAERG